MALLFKSIFRSHRIFTHRVNAPGVSSNSVVMASLTEIGRSNPAGPLDNRFIGDATMKIYNVAPTANAVWVRGEIDWDSDLDIELNVFAAD